MWKHLSILFCATAAGIVSPAQAAETRITAFTLSCNGTIQDVVFEATDLGASVNRFIQGAGLAVSALTGGVKFLRLQAAGDDTRIVLTAGAGNTTARTDLTASLIKVTTNPVGVVPFQVVGTCTGGGTMKGYALLVFFS